MNSRLNKELICGKYILYKNSINSEPVDTIELRPDNTIWKDINTVTNKWHYWQIYNNKIKILNQNYRNKHKFIPYKYLLTYADKRKNYYLRKIKGVVPISTDSTDSIIVNQEEHLSLNVIPFNIENCKDKNCFTEILSTELKPVPATYDIVYNSSIYNHGVVLLSDNTICPKTSYQCELRSRDLSFAMSESNDGIGLPYSIKEEHKTGTWILLNNLVCNYAHLHIQAFSGIEILRQVKDLFPDIKIFFTDFAFHKISQPSYEEYKIEAIKKFNLDQYEIINPIEAPGTVFHVERLIVPSNLGDPLIFGLNKHYVDALRGVLKVNYLSEPLNKRYFLSRSDNYTGSVRDIVNHKELSEELSTIGFETIEIGKLDYHTQMQILSDAEIVVGAHGGAFTNILSHPGNLKVFEIFHTFQVNCWFKNLANLCGHKYAFYCVDPIENHWQSNFYVDAKHVKSCVENFLST